MKRSYLILLALFGFFLALAVGAAAGGGAAYLLLSKPDIVSAQRGQPEFEPDEGLLVSHVDPDSPAARAGIARGDILLSMDGESLNSSQSLLDLMRERTPGDQVSLTFLHGDEFREATVELESRQDWAYLGLTFCGAGHHQGQAFPEGMIPPGFDFIFSGQPAAMVVEVLAGGPAEEAGLQAGDAIQAVDGQDLQDGNLAEALQPFSPGDSITLAVQRGAESLEIPVILGAHPDDPQAAFLGVSYRRLPMGLTIEGEKFFGDERFPGLPHGPFDEGFPFGRAFGPGQLPAGIESALVLGEVSAGSPAAEAGLLPDDLIIAVNGDPIQGMETLVDAVQQAEPGDEIQLSVARGADETIEITVSLGAHPDDPDQAYLGVVIMGFIQVERQEGPPADGLAPETRFDRLFPPVDAESPAQTG